ncbi:menaquinone-dependent protoporphyrinogen IX dehydrogenase [Shewanella sp. AS1]|uniref:menaquinone-dependent protoporphyrinogen IX dehydrogenase n=1 Tax=Shewanella sp. AS1 TaxID=2907626 RepID=UPI001F43F673|nr:menaquinone-dependent protoporphyrinogen IX dehydrogenase [Shewanella sp. AS1]MCE9677686.1 menaquinone-dependent protoporphyrinogen IX dehydrogenase [Shewanella sp. AS1]
MSKILIVYSSVHGQTRKVTDFIKQQLEALGDEVTCTMLEDAPELGSFDKIVIGASIRHGKHNPGVYQFISRNLALLNERPNSFFSVSLVARKAAKNTPETNPYMQAFLTKTPWQPKLLAVFGGNLNYQGYNALDRNIIRFIMWLTKGPTAADTQVEYTDWEKVTQYAKALHQL